MLYIFNTERNFTFLNLHGKNLFDKTKFSKNAVSDSLKLLS